MVEKAVRILLRLIEDPSVSRSNAVVPGERILRSSARRPRHGIRCVEGRDTWSSCDAKWRSGRDASEAVPE